MTRPRPCALCDGGLVHSVGDICLACQALITRQRDKERKLQEEQKVKDFEILKENERA